MYRTIFFLWMAWSFIPQTFCQNIDSLKTVLPDTHDSLKATILQQIAFKLLKEEPHVAIAYFTKSVELSTSYRQHALEVDGLSGLAYCYEILQDSTNTKSFYDQTIAKAAAYRLPKKQAKQHTFYGNYLNMTSDVLLALDQYQKANQIYKSLKDTLNIIDCEMRMANAFDVHGDYLEALERNLKTYALAKAFKDTLGIASLNNNIAIIYKKQGKIDEALAYYTKVIELLRNTKYKYSIANTKVNIGLVYKDKNRLDSALVLMHQSLHYFEANEETFAKSQTYHNIGVVHQKGKRFDSALFYLSKSQVLAKKNGYVKNKIQNYLSLAEINQELRKYKEAMLHSDSAIKASEQIASLEDLRKSYKTRYQIYEKQGDLVEAFKSLKLYQAYNDSLFNDEKKQQINFLKSQAELKQKQQELAIVAHEAKISALHKEHAKNWNYALIAGVFTLFLICCILFISRNNKIKASQLLEEKSIKLVSQHAKIEKQQKKLVKKNKRLKKLNEDKNDLISMVSHDLRSPLNQIKGLINILKLCPNLNADGQEIIAKIALSTERLREMINRTLDLKAIESSRINLKSEVFDLIEVTSTVADNFNELAAEKNIQIEKQLFLEDCFISADKNYVIQILENLLSNALKFSPHDGLVAINMQNDGLKLKLSVTDTGPGIPKKDRKRLFKPFQKLSNRPTNNEDSSGLGLAIVKKYVEAMGGMVTYEDSPGGGSCFTVSFIRQTVIDAVSA